MLRRNIVTSTTLALAVGLSFIGASIQAESACKGLERNLCEKRQDSCSWVGAYTRKDGVEVAGHCKSKPGKSVKSEDKKSEGKKEILESK